jgi:hypothetical protein
LAALALITSSGQDPNAKVFTHMGATGPGKYLNTILKRFGTLFGLVLTSHSARHSAVDIAGEHWMVLIHWVIMRGDWVLDSISTFFEYASFSSKSDRKIARALSEFAMIDRGGFIASLDAISDVTVRAKVANLAKTIFSAPVPASLQAPFIATLLMHYKACKELSYIVSILEFKFISFDITIEEMTVASEELKADFILKNIESLPTENSGMPSSITAKLVEMESHVRTMQVQSAQMCQRMNEIAQENTAFQRTMLELQNSQNSFITTGFNHIQGVIISVGSRIISALSGTVFGADPVQQAPIDDALGGIEEFQNAEPAVTEAHEVERRRADNNVFPDIYEDIKSKNTRTALTDMLVSKIHLKSMPANGSQRLKVNRQLLIRVSQNLVA